jgi:hypothetical protein
VSVAARPTGQGQSMASLSVSVHTYLDRAVYACSLVVLDPLPVVSTELFGQLRVRMNK